MARGIVTRQGAETKRSTVDPITKSVAFDSYKSCPKKEKTLSQYRDICEKRLSVLKKVEEADGTKIEAANKLMEDILRRTDLLYVNKGGDDKISHFMLRLGHCKSRDKRDWFIEQEKKLFEMRWELARKEQRQAVIRELSGNCAAVQLDKADLFRLGLIGKSPIPHMSAGENTTTDVEKSKLPYHKVPFSEVPGLVGIRAVYLEDGFAYIPNDLFKTYISGKYRAHLSESLNTAAQRFDKLAEGDSNRVLSLIRQIGSLTRGPVYTGENSEHMLKPRDVPRVAASHFPLCMRVMERQMKHDAHLKHKGRLYYGKFLKGCGMSCDDQIGYYRKLFTKKMSAKKFDGEYKYGIRHHYGLEGRKKNYSPNSCNTLISEISGPGEYHACPYKAYDKGNLSKLLKSFRMSDSSIKEITTKAEGGHHQLACRSFFTAVNRGKMLKKKMELEDIECTWAHPNAYYNASCKVNEKKKEDEAGEKMM